MKLTQRPIEWDLALRDEEHAVANLEDKLGDTRNEIQLKRYNLARKKENDWEWEERRLKERLKDLQQETLDNQDFIESTNKRVADFRYREHEVKQRQLQAEDELIKAIRLNHLDQIVQAKLDLEKLQEQREEVEAKELRNNAYLQALADEQDRRDYQSVASLERIMHKAENIEAALQNGDLNQQEQATLAHALQERGDAALKQRKKIVDEIVAKRERQRQQDALQQEAHIRNLNEQRWELIQQHEVLLRKKEIHGRLAERGVDFLAALEQRKGPSEDLIVSNLGDIEVDPAEFDKPITEVIENVSSGINALNERIQHLKEEKDKTVRYIQ